MVALYHPDEKLAGRAASILCSKHSDVRDSLLSDREEILRLRIGSELTSKQDAQTRAEIYRSLRASAEALSRLNEEVLPRLKDQLAEADLKIERLGRVRIAEAEFETEWESRVQEKRDAICRARGPVQEGTSAVYGFGEGQRNVDRIPPSARITAIKYRFGDRLDGIQLIYTVGGVTGHTEWRGGMGGEEHTIVLGDNEYITSVVEVPRIPARQWLAIYGEMERIEMHTNHRDIVLGQSDTTERTPLIQRAENINLQPMGERGKAIGLITYQDGEIRGLGFIVEGVTPPTSSELQAFLNSKAEEKKNFVSMALWPLGIKSFLGEIRKSLREIERPPEK